MNQNTDQNKTRCSMPLKFAHHVSSSMPWTTPWPCQRRPGMAIHFGPNMGDAVPSKSHADPNADVWCAWWWLEHEWIIFPLILRISSSQLTNSMIFQRGSNHQPERHGAPLTCMRFGRWIRAGVPDFRRHFAWFSDLTDWHHVWLPDLPKWPVC